MFLDLQSKTNFILNTYKKIMKIVEHEYLKRFISG